MFVKKAIDMTMFTLPSHQPGTLCLVIRFSFLPLFSFGVTGLVTKRDTMEEGPPDVKGREMSCLLFNFGEQTFSIPGLPERERALHPSYKDEWWVLWPIWSCQNQPTTSLLCLPGVPSLERQDRKCSLI